MTDTRAVRRAWLESELVWAEAEQERDAFAFFIAIGQALASFAALSPRAALAHGRHADAINTSRVYRTRYIAELRGDLDALDT